MKNNIILWIEQYLFEPNWVQRLISFLFLPLSLIYNMIVRLKRYTSTPKTYNIPIISIGNLTVGGSSKTPFLISLVSHFSNSAIVLRGYARSSSGLYIIKHQNQILENISTSGDEAMLYALSCDATVIVSEDRTKAILQAQKLGAKQIFLDDGFNKTKIEKYNILLHNEKKPTNIFTLPSGCYKEPRSFVKYADLNLIENKDFIKSTNIKNQTKNMILITAISKPKRLDEFLPSNIITKIYFPDHYDFDKQEIQNLVTKYNASSVLCTTKDWVKLRSFDVPLSILELQIDIKPYVIDNVSSYIQKFHKNLISTPKTIFES